YPTLLSMRLLSELERVAPAETLPLLQRFVAAQPDDWEALRALARAEQALGRRSEAENHFQACLKGRPNDVRAWRDYLTMLQQEGRLDTLMELLPQLPQAADSEPEIWRFRGQAKEKAGDLEGAAAAYRKAIELNPCVAAYQYRLEMVEHRLGLDEQAAQHRQRARQLREAQGQLRDAYNNFVQANVRHEPGPDPITSAKRLADICETMGWLRPAEALNRLTSP
ncbi:MAG: tetratricopeptide repeat protein, partial [Isosphaeraceae bacterium]